MRKFLVLISCAMVFSLSLKVPVSHADERVSPLLTLEEAVKMAVNGHFSVKEAEEKLKASREEKISAGADFLPKASATYSYAGIKDRPFSKASGTAMQTADRSQFHWDVAMVQPLFTGFALSSKYAISGLAVSMKAEEKRQALLDVAYGVKKAYFDVLLSRHFLKVADEEVAALKAQEEDARKFYDEGLIPRNDLLRSQVALANAIQDREMSRAEERLALSRLNILLERDIDHPTGVIDMEESSEANLDLKVLIDEAIGKRPVLRLTRLGIETLEKSISLTRSAYYPDVSLVGKYEENGDDYYLSENDFSNRHNASVYLEAKWTFFEWGKTRADVAKVRHDRNALVHGLKGIEDDVKLEVKNALLRLRVAFTNIDTARKALDQAKENWRITKIQYRQQIVTSSDVLDARAYLTQADTNYYRALYGYMASMAGLERAVGRA